MMDSNDTGRTNIKLPSEKEQLEGEKQKLREILSTEPQVLVEVAFLSADPDALALLPEWRRRAFNEFSRVIFPTLADIRKPISKASSEGRLMGHILALLTEFRTPNGLLSDLSPDIKKMIGKVEEFLNPMLSDLVPEALKHPRKDAADFFEGVAFAMNRTFDEGGAVFRFTDASLIYLAIACIPEAIAKMRSVTELHELLCTAFGRNWDLDRTKKNLFTPPSEVPK